MSEIPRAKAQALRLSEALDALETALAGAPEPGADFDACAEALAAPVREFGACARRALAENALQVGSGE